MPDKPNYCELDWSIQQHTTGRRLTASAGRSGGWDCTWQAKSDIYDCFVELLIWPLHQSPFLPFGLLVVSATQRVSNVVQRKF